MISHPLRRDSAGAVVTVDDFAPRAAAEVAGHVVSCLLGERPLAPLYGMREAALAGVSPDMVAAAIGACEPELRVLGAEVSNAGPDRVRIQANVEWSQS